jgi:L-arginine ABC transporter membrane protein
MLDYLPELMKGLHTSLTLTVASIIVALILALIFTIVLTLKTPVLVWIVRGYITLFTGTPLLVQIFLIYYGPGQFPSLQEYPVIWHLLSEPWLCALIALSLNSAAYTTQLFYGRHSRDPGRPVAVLRGAGHEQEGYAGDPAALCL